MPMFPLKFYTHDYQSITLQALLDTGSTYNLISRKYAQAITGKAFIQHERAHYPVLTLAGGQRQQALAAIRLEPCTEHNQQLPPRTFFVFDNLSVDIIYGATTCQAWNAQIDWKTRTWNISPTYREPISIPFTLQYGKYYTAAIALFAAEDTIVQPGKQAYVATQHNLSKTNSHYNKCGWIYGCVPNGLAKFMTAEGPSIKASWIQVANITNEPIIITRASQIAWFRPLPADAMLCQTIEDIIGTQQQEQTNVSAARKVNASNIAVQKVKANSATQKVKANSATQNVKANSAATKRSKVKGETTARSAVGQALQGARNGTDHPNLRTAASANPYANVTIAQPKLNTIAQPKLNIKTTNAKTQEQQQFPHPALQYTKEQIDAMSESEVDKLLDNIVTRDIKFENTKKSINNNEEFITLKKWCLKRTRSLTDGKHNLHLENPKHPHKMRILTDVPDPPVRARPYKSSPRDRIDVAAEVKTKLTAGIIEPSSSPWSSNVLVVRRDGKVRLCTDYRTLNKHTIKDQYTLPKISELFDALHGAKYFSSCDAHAAYHQLPMADERSKDLTSFITPDGSTYRYKYCAFGLVNAPAEWSRLIDNCLKTLRWDVCLVYMDDILIWTKTNSIHEHIRDLDRVFDALDTYGIKMKASKCQFALRELPFLGHIVTTEGIKPDPAKIKAIADLPVPTNIKQLRSQCGTFSYYRKFIKNYADICNPLTEALRDTARYRGKRLTLNADETHAWNTLKKHLTSEPIMNFHPDWSKQFILDTDASPIGVSAVLSQDIEGKERVVMYASRKLTDIEKKYHQYEREALAFVWSIELFRQYLYGRKFLARTDNEALKYIKTRTTNARTARWIMRLQEFTFDIQHRAGKHNANADGPSRNPLPSTNPYNEPQTEPLYDTRTEFVCPALAMPALTRSRAKTNKAETQSEPIGKRTRSNTKRSRHTPDQHTITSNNRNAQTNANPKRQKSKTTERTQNNTQTSWFQNDTTAWTLNDFKEKQHDKTDPLLNHILENIDKPNSAYTLIDGIVVQKRKNTKRAYRIVVPTSLRAFVLGMHHGLPLTGHTGFRKTHALIKQRFWWPRMKQDIRRWVKCCSLCARRKIPRPLKCGLTQSMTQRIPFHTIALDIVGPVLPNAEGHEYILTGIDVFTRYPIAIPLHNRKASTIMKAIYEHIICQHGIPMRILSDQGKEFIDQGIKTLCSHWGIKKIQTTGYNSTGNSHVERFHRFLNAAMTILYDKHSTEWDLHLPALLFSYRVTPHETTGYSPAYLLYGRHPNLPTDLLFDASALRDASFKTHKEYATHIHKSLKHAFSLARAAQEKHARINTDRLNASRTNAPNFKVGEDRVYYWKSTASEHRVQTDTDEYLPLRDKWSYWWQGPYDVVKRNSARHYTIRVDNTLVKANVNRLALASSWSRNNPDTSTWLSQIRPSEPTDLIIQENARHATREPGHIIIFATNITDSHPCAFGVARLLDKCTNNEPVCAQWYGNMTNNMNGTYKPCWYIKDTHQYYYAHKPEKRSKLHTPYTFYMSNTKITPTQILYSGFALLDNNDKLKNHIWQKIKTHPLVAPRIPPHIK